MRLVSFKMPDQASIGVYLPIFPLHLMNWMIAMMREPKAMEPRWYTKVFFVAARTGKLGILAASPPAQ